MATSFTIDYTVATLGNVKEWRSYSLDITPYHNINIRSKMWKPIVAKHIWLYDNGNILALLAFDNKYVLLSPHAILTKPLIDISKEIYDGAYRITHDVDDKTGRSTVSVIRDVNGKEVIGYKKWKEITDIHNDLAIIEIWSGTFVLQSLRDRSHGNNFIGASKDVVELSYMSPNLYKFKRKGEDGYQLYRTTGNDNRGIDSIDAYPNHVFIEIKPLSDRIAIGTESDGTICFINTTLVPESDKFKIIGQTKPEDCNIDYNYNVITFSGIYYGDNHKENVKDLVIDFDGIKSRGQVETTIETTPATVEKEDVSSVEEQPTTSSVKQEEEKKPVSTEIINEAIKLKIVYTFLEGKKYNTDAIYECISALFPGFENRLLMITDVKENHPELFDDIKRFTDYSENRKDRNYILGQLNLTKDQTNRLNDALIIGGKSFTDALRSIDETGKLSNVYSDIMNSDSRLKATWGKIGRYVIDEIAKYLPEVNDEYQKLIETADKRPNEKSTDKVRIPLNGGKECTLDEIVDYNFFNNIRVTFSVDRPKYVQVGQNVCLFLDKETAKEFDNKNEKIITMDGEGEKPQYFGRNLNSVLRKKANDRGSIFVFLRNDKNTCKLFDEFEVLKVEQDDDVIVCKYQSKYRYV